MVQTLQAFEMQRSLGRPLVASGRIESELEVFVQQDHYHYLKQVTFVVSHFVESYFAESEWQFDAEGHGLDVGGFFAFVKCPLQPSVALQQ